MGSQGSGLVFQTMVFQLIFVTLNMFFRENSEIDHTYLSIEAQCVSHYYPRWTATTWNTIV